MYGWGWSLRTRPYQGYYGPRYGIKLGKLNEMTPTKSLTLRANPKRLTRFQKGLCVIPEDVSMDYWSRK